MSPAEQRPKGTSLDGVVELRGSFEERGDGQLQQNLAEALVRVLAPVTGCDGRTTPCSASVAVGTRTSEASIEYSFKVELADANDLPAALALLKLEASLGGAKRLLPQLAAGWGGGPGEMAGRLSLRRLEVLAPASAPTTTELLLLEEDVSNGEGTADQSPL